MKNSHPLIQYSILLEYRLKNIQKDLLTQGHSEICPVWPCKVCNKLFPKTIKGSCPCIDYTSSYLVKRLNQIMNHYGRYKYKYKDTSNHYRKGG